MAYISQGSRTKVAEFDFACVVKFDDDLPNGPFVEGSAGNMLQPGLGFSVSVPSTGATWSLVSQLVAKHHQVDLDKFCKGGEMRSMGGGHRVGTVATCTPKCVVYKGGEVPDEAPAKEGSCTVQVSISTTTKRSVLCAIQ